MAAKRDHLLTAEDSPAKKAHRKFVQKCSQPCRDCLVTKASVIAPVLFEHVNGGEYATWNDRARKMGANMVERLLHDRHECVVFDMKAADVSKLTGQGAIGAKSLDDVVSKLTPPRVGVDAASGVVKPILGNVAS